MPTDKSNLDAQTAPETEPESERLQRRQITDPRAMRAMAHPVRLALLEAIGQEGEITATRAAELLDQSPGNMSWHLQTLAKYGFIEEVPGAKGRSRPWRVASFSNRFRSTTEEPGVKAASQALSAVLIERSNEQLRRWWRDESSYSHEWREAAYLNDSLTFLTAQELTDLGEQITALTSQFNERIDPAKRPKDALPVHFAAHAHPVPSTEQDVPKKPAP